MKKINSLQDFTQRLEKVKPLGGGEYRARCPAHEDDNPSLSVTERNNKILVYCHAGCSTREILDAMGLDDKDLFLKQNGSAPTRTDIVATYDYRDEEGNLLYQVCRTEDKSFPQRRPVADGWKWGLGNTKRVLYKIPKVKEAIEKGRYIFLVEGEKDVDNLEKLGFAATCNPMGAGKWNNSYTDALEGANVVILPDNDEEGLNHARRVGEELKGNTSALKALELPDLPEKGDVSDWIKTGGTAKELKQLVKEEKAFSNKLALTSEKEDKPAKKKEGGRKATYYSMAIDVAPEDLQDAPTFPKNIAKDLPVIGKYVSWIDDNTETPASFAFAAFKNQLGLLLGRRIKTAYGQTDHYPIFYDGLIGESALSRKSSTIKVANKIMQKATSIQKEKKDYMVIPGVGSAEGVLKKIEGSPEVIQGQHAKALLKLDEMSVLTDKLGQSKTQTFISRLNELWDVPPEVINPTIGNPIEIERPTVSLLAGSTAENLKGAWEERTIEGGFFNRFCWWTSSELKVEPEAEKMPQNIENEIVKKVQGVVDFAKKLEGHEYVKSEEAQERFKKWYTEWRKKLEEKDEISVVIARIPEQVIRHALLFSLLQGQDEITLEALEKAIKIGNYLQKTAYHVLERFTETSSDKLKKRVFRVLNERGEVKKSKLTQATSSYLENGVGELNRLLDDLENLEIIETTGD